MRLPSLFVATATLIVGTIYDAPNFLPPMSTCGKGETWRATFKTFVICGCKVVREVNRVRQMTPEVSTYIVKSITIPSEADYLPFQKLSAEQGFNPWP